MTTWNYLIVPQSSNIRSLVEGLLVVTKIQEILQPKLVGQSLFLIHMYKVYICSILLCYLSGECQTSRNEYWCESGFSNERKYWRIEESNETYLLWNILFLLGAGIKCSTKNGSTALHFAASNELLDVIDFLLS